MGLCIRAYNSMSLKHTFLGYPFLEAHSIIPLKYRCPIKISNQITHVYLTVLPVVVFINQNLVGTHDMSGGKTKYEQ